MVLFFYGYLGFPASLDSVFFLRFSGSLVLWFDGSMFLWFSSTLVPLCLCRVARSSSSLDRWAITPVGGSASPAEGSSGKSIIIGIVLARPMLDHEIHLLQSHTPSSQLP